MADHGPASIRIDTAAGPQIVQGWPCDVPGLLVTGRVSQVFAVVHTHSGASLMDLPNPEAALHAARVLGQSGVDWTRPLAELRAVPDVGMMVAGVAKHLGASIGSRQAPAAEVNP